MSDNWVRYNNSNQENDDRPVDGMGYPMFRQTRNQILDFLDAVAIFTSLFYQLFTKIPCEQTCFAP